MSENTPSRDTLSRTTLSRRAVVVGAGAVGAGIAVAGCGAASGGAASGGGASGGGAGGAAAGTVLGPSSDVPVGSAKIFTGAAVVVTQATAGSFAGFSTACPHQGCAVAEVKGTDIVCPCHGSTFALDGSVLSGPATSGLASKAVTVSGGQVTLA